MFRLPRRREKAPLTDVKSAQRWLASFNPAEQLPLVAALVHELTLVAHVESRRTLHGLEALFHVDTAARELCSALTAQYLDHAGRSTAIEDKLWQSIYDLTQAFLLAYAAYHRKLADLRQYERWQRMMPELMARQLAHMTVDAKVRMFRCEHWIPAKWGDLHELFAMACGRKIERASVDLGDGKGPTTIEQKYIETLVLQLMNTGNLKPAHVEWVARQLESWCARLHLALEPSMAVTFYVDLSQRHGLRRRTSEPLRGRVLFLDTAPIIALLHHYVLALEDRIRSRPLSERSLKRLDQMTLVNRLAAHVDPQFRPVPRRGERVQATGTLEAIAGFQHIASYLRADDRVPADELDSKATFGDTLELAVFGRRRRTDPPDAKERRRLEAFVVSGGPWELVDVSDTGLRVHVPDPAGNGIVLGSLVLVRPEGQMMWGLTMVSRMKRLSAERAEVGLQVIADSAVPVDLVPERGARDASYAVDDNAPENVGRSVRALFLLMRRRGEGSAVQSVVVSSAEYDAGKRYTVRTRKSEYPIRFGRLMEQQLDWTWAVVEPITLTHDVAGMMPGSPEQARTADE